MDVVVHPAPRQANVKTREKTDDWQIFKTRYLQRII
jgi:hypothetical protein